jgi:hypothetical protein
MSIVNTKYNHASRRGRTNRSQNSFYGPGKYKFAIYPDYWKESWGEKPLLGYVWADDEFYAEREAYNRGLLTVNFTFRPKAVKLHAPRVKGPRS